MPGAHLDGDAPAQPASPAPNILPPLYVAPNYVANNYDCVAPNCVANNYDCVANNYDCVANNYVANNYVANNYDYVADNYDYAANNYDCAANNYDCVANNYVANNYDYVADNYDYAANNYDCAANNYDCVANNYVANNCVANNYDCVASNYVANSGHDEFAIPGFIPIPDLFQEGFGPANSVKELQKSLNAWAKHYGFTIARIQARKKRWGVGYTQYNLVCSRCGPPTAPLGMKLGRSRKCNCNWMVQARLEDGGWFIRPHSDPSLQAHNHGASVRPSPRRRHRRSAAEAVEGATK
ncbi:hypothetical protein B0T17DRAFT_512724 [Bombardia bombarda]|uniref:Uncharacterized protein n=1 Tax=Bombardia bombarda TaxID=252184 RepID=A0AA39U1S5_9PEZI|nr:hypothetical protein B0T17DRAFT_512724 [Bombardia bombarda]